MQPSLPIGEKDAGTGRAEDKLSQTGTDELQAEVYPTKCIMLCYIEALKTITVNTEEKDADCINIQTEQPA